jgi:hypothetical protein
LQSTLPHGTIPKGGERGTNSGMTSRDSASAIRVLRWLIAASIVFPLALFGYAGVTNYRAAWTGADERLERTLDVLQEHALKVFETVDLAIEATTETLRGLSDEAIRRSTPASRGFMTGCPRSAPSWSSTATAIS